MAKLFVEGLDTSDKIQLKEGKQNINDFLNEGSFFIETSDTSNMPNDYRNEWVWLFVRRSDNRILQIMAPDNGGLGWLCIRTVAIDESPRYYSAWNVIDFAKGKILQVGGIVKLLFTRALATSRHLMEVA